MGFQSAEHALSRMRDPVWQMRLPARLTVCAEICWSQPRHPAADQAAAAADRGGGPEGDRPAEKHGQHQLGPDVELAWVLLSWRWAASATYTPVNANPAGLINS